jgi:hypothetical protein
MVDLESILNSFLVNLASRFDFPTPESPISTTKDGNFASVFWEHFSYLLAFEKKVIVFCSHCREEFGKVWSAGM